MFEDLKIFSNEFKQRTPRVLQEMRARWLPTLVNTVYCRKNTTRVNGKFYHFMRQQRNIRKFSLLRHIAETYC